MPKDRFEAENEGVNIVIDCTGVPAALEKAIQWTKITHCHAPDIFEDFGHFHFLIFSAW